MANFTVTKKVEGDVYQITHTKIVKDVGGIDRTIVDRTEQLTIKQLEDKKQMVVDQITSLTAQVADFDSFRLLK